MAFGNPITTFIYNHSPTAVRSFMATIYSSGRGKKKFGRKFEEYITDLARTQWYSNEDILTLQEFKLRRVIGQSFTHVPYYENRSRSAGIDATQIKTREDLRILPIIQKVDAQKHLAQLRSRLYMEPSSVEILHTSGTTGKAIDVAVDREYLKLEKAFLWLQRSWVGVKPGDKTAYFTGHPIVPVRKTTPPFWVFDRSENRTFFSLQHMSKENLRHYVQQLKLAPPRLVVGYPTAIYMMALALLNMGVTSVRPAGIFTASETLLPHQRKAIEQAFSSKILDLYGQVEYCGMVLQCEKGEYHIQDEYGVMEIIRPDGSAAANGEIGEIICTGLNNMAMPFIRYRTGDTAIRKAGCCSCGRNGALIERITGRMEDVVVTPDGRFISRLDFVFKEMPFIQEAQIVQEERKRLRIRFVPGTGFSESALPAIAKNLRERVGEGMQFEFERLDAIPRLPNGKFRYVVSKVSLDIGGAQQTGALLGTSRDEDRTL